MTQKDKNLLLKDLCARLPYHPILNWKFTDNTSQDEELKELSDLYIWWITKAQDCEVKLYLRPMSSMTEDEKKELERLIDEKLNRNTDQEDDEWTPWVLYDTTGIKNYIGGEKFYFDEMGFIYDWLNAHHFDHRGLIEKNLALEAPEGMYKTE